jgi:hypothetical protein
MRSLVVILACITCIDDAQAQNSEDDGMPKTRQRAGRANFAEFLLAMNPRISSNPTRSQRLNEGARMQTQSIGLNAASPGEVPVTPASAPEDFEFLPVYPKIERIEGTGTVRTYQMPIWADRCQYMVRSAGDRPLKAEVNLWIGPLRQVHACKIDTEKGAEAPVQGTIKFKKLAPVLKIFTNKDELNYPIEVAVVVPSPERSKQLENHFMTTWRSATKGIGMYAQKQLIQGGSTIGGKSTGSGGSVRSWVIPPEVEAVEVLGWSGDVGKKSFKMQFEVLHGVNNVKQKIFFQCGGSTQPYNAVLQVPYGGCVIRVKNVKFVEDGLCEFAIVPYKYHEASAADLQPVTSRW